MIECLLNLPSYQYNDNSLTMINIANHQQIYTYVMQNAQLDQVHFPVKITNNVTIVCYCEQITMTDNQWSNSSIEDRWCNKMVSPSIRTPRKPKTIQYIYRKIFYPGLSTICQWNDQESRKTIQTFCSTRSQHNTLVHNLGRPHWTMDNNSERTGIEI